MNYYFTITLVILVTLIGCRIMILHDENLDHAKRKRIATIFSVLIIGTICETVGELEIGDNSFISFIKSSANMIEIYFRPLVPLGCSVLMFECKQQNLKLTLYTIIVMISVIFSELSDVPIVATEMFIFFSAEMIYCVLKFGKRHQNDKHDEITVVSILLLICTLAQLKSIKIFWLIMTIVQILLFIYYNNTLQRNDGLTGLLSQKIYKMYLENNKNRKFSMIIFDVNYFKEINDTYGHAFGDDVLKIIGKAIKKQYSKYGYCYRIGGDEFAVIIEKEINMEKINTGFISLLAKERIKLKELPHVSYGMGTYDPKKDKNVKEAIEKADKNMYQYKKEFKEKNKPE